MEKDKEYETLLDYNKLKNLWSIKTIQRIHELYNSCFNVLNDPDITNFETKDNLIRSYLKSINSMLDDSDKDFQKLIRNSNSG